RNLIQTRRSDGMTGNRLTAEMVADHFVGWICENKARSKHVRRVSHWFGFVAKGIERIADEWGYHRTRQFWFRIGPKLYKVRYTHDIGFRGGLQIVEIDGNADGPVAIEFRNLDDAEAFYNRPTLAPSALVTAA